MSTTLPRSRLLAERPPRVLSLGLAICLTVSFGCGPESDEVPVDPIGWIAEIEELTPETKMMLGKIMVPQASPERCVRLEIALMRQGFYYRDVTLYDKAWRRPVATSAPSRQLKADAREMEGQFAVKLDGGHAIAYFQGGKARVVGPRFLRLTEAGWILDTSSVYDNIIYGSENHWAAVDGDYPYLRLLKSVYDMKPVRLEKRGRAWAIR